MTIGNCVVCGVLAVSALCISMLQAQTAPNDSALIDELVLANHILSMNGVLDAYGHVSVRSQRNPNHFYLARHMAAGVVTRADIIEYDFDCKPVSGDASRGYTERFIHGEIYRARPDVMAVVHSHPADVIAFSVTGVPMRPLTHMAAFLEGPVPVFEIRNAGGMTDMLIRDSKLGRALAQTLGRQKCRPAARARRGSCGAFTPRRRRPILLYDGECQDPDGSSSDRRRKGHLLGAGRSAQGRSTGRLRTRLGVVEAAGDGQMRIA